MWIDREKIHQYQNAKVSNQEAKVSNQEAKVSNQEAKVSNQEAKVSNQEANQQYQEAIEKRSALKDASVGGVVRFGAYEQDRNSSNGKEEIEWVVLAKENDRILIISKYGLVKQFYNTSRTDVTWETCSLRTWLNGDFIRDAFSSGERNMIQTTTVTADKNPQYKTSPGNDTTDKVFLLSITEATKYFSSDEARMCGAEGGKLECRWWLRSPGANELRQTLMTGDGSVESDGTYAAFVGPFGSIIFSGGRVNGSEYVRPAMWIDLGS